jgi:hypothetical protein
MAKAQMPATSDAARTAEDVARFSLPRWLQLFMASTFGEFVLYDVFISGLIGIAVWAVDKSTAGITAFLLSAIFFLIIKLYSEMVKMHHEFDASLHLEDEAIQHVRADILRIIDVNHALWSDSEFLRYDAQILKAYSTLLSSNDAWFLDRARFVLKDCSQELTRLSSGEIYHGINSDFYGILRQQLLDTKASAFLTSDVRSDFSWSGGAGKEYRMLNMKRAAESIDITRVFIVDNLNEIAGDVRALIDEQLTAKMNVRIALASDLGRDALYDMGIYDERYVSYFDLAPTSSHEIREHRTLNTPEALQRASGIRNRLYQNSEDASVLLARMDPKPD